MIDNRSYEERALHALRQAVADALERKRRLGQYAVFWRDGRVVCIGPDAPPDPKRQDKDSGDSEC